MDIREVRDFELLKKVTECTRDICPISELEAWFINPKHHMFLAGEDNVGLATYEYPGMYTVHWYYTVRGREAIELAKRMIANLFENYGAQAVRGLIKDNMKASRWACRQVGLKSQGFMTFEDGDVNELFTATKSDFMKDKIYG